MNGSAGRPGASAYAALVEWENFGRLAALAPGLGERIAVAEASVFALARYRAALARLIEADLDPAAAMAGSVRFVDAARARVNPSTWWEALVVAVAWVPMIDVLVGADQPGTFAAGVFDSGFGKVGYPAQDLSQRDGWAVWRVREAVEADPALGARLVLWGRRLGGEAVALAADFAAAQEAPASRPAVGATAGATAKSTAADQASTSAAPSAQAVRMAAFAALADRVAQAHTAALAPLFGEQEAQPAAGRAAKN